ncbi:hypothetical protein [Deinococcus sp. Marseille-Q6407]|uniref:hypothetical protein n=1 Tax=Deinococcus sp. Marseille-Q6407 TaxID=2969223 RepID=UPI0021C14399|nr:hypothetical protein [Deinococcus sp. Marseille-Q6407]
MLAAALSALLLALAFAGPLLLPQAWNALWVLPLAGLLALVLGGLVRRAGSDWGAALLWLAWVFAVMQWGWALGGQPAGFPYWLAGLGLGLLGAALVRPEVAPAAEALPEEVVPQPQAQPVKPDATPASRTAPLEVPPPPEPAPVTLLADAADWTVAIQPPPAAVSPPEHPVWAVPAAPAALPSAEVKPPAQAASPADQPLLPQAEEPRPAPALAPTSAPAAWQNQTWWASEDEPGSADGADESHDWAEAEAVLEREREAEQRRREAQAARQRRNKEEIEDRE